jgi:hypothetical protein
MDGDNEQLSAGTLRAELALLELRIVTQLDERLRHKADAATVLPLLTRIEAIDRGDFSPSLKRALADFVEERAVAATGQRWTRRERLMGVIGTCVFLFGFLMSLAINLRVVMG